MNTVASYFAHMMYARELVLVGLVVVLTSQVTQKKKKAHNTVIVFFLVLKVKCDSPFAFIVVQKRVSAP